MNRTRTTLTDERLVIVVMITVLIILVLIAAGRPTEEMARLQMVSDHPECAETMYILVESSILVPNGGEVFVTSLVCDEANTRIVIR